MATKVLPGDTGNPQADIAPLVEGLFGDTFPASKTVENKDNLSNKSATRPPSFAPYLQSAQTGQDDLTKKPQYSEDLPQNTLSKAFSLSSNLGSQFNSLKDKTPEERAKFGSRFGAGIGIASNGIAGGLIGAGVGAVAARAVGLKQSGEYEDNRRLGKLTDTFQTLGIASKEGTIAFSDGGAFKVDLDPTTRLQNMSSLANGKKDRGITEIDTSHPMANRTLAVVKPLAHMLGGTVLGWGDSKNPRDVKGVDNATGILANALLQDAENINQVYTRAKEVATKLGIKKEDASKYFKLRKNDFSEKELNVMQKGLELIYA